MSAMFPEFEGQDIEADGRPGRTALLQWAMLIGLFVLVAAAVVTGILVTWAMVQPVLPNPTSTPAAPRSVAPVALLPATGR